MPLSAKMAAWLSPPRPTPSPTLDVPNGSGMPLSYPNVYNGVLRPALVEAGIAIKLGDDEKGRPVYEYPKGLAFHAFRHACQTILHDVGKTPAQGQAWLRHSQLITTINVYTRLAERGMGGADVFDEVLGVGALRG